MLCSLLNNWNYFWNKYFSLLFPAICRSQLPLLVFLASSWYQKANYGYEWACKIKKWLIIILKGFIKQSVIKQSLTFLSFCSHWLLHKSLLSSLIKAVANFVKMIRFRRQPFIVHKNGENLKILIEKSYQKRIISSVI